MKFLKYLDAGISDAVIYNFAEKFRLPIKVIQLIVSRGYTTEKEIRDFLNPSYQMLNDPFQLKNMRQALDRINQALNHKEKILIFGDYDVDGVSATAVMIKTFEKLNYKVNFYLPNRYIDGYGLTNEVLDKIKKQFNPTLIITVDCGISAWKEVEYAKTLGMDVIITDHHEIPEILPDTIVIDPKMEGQEYPFKELCGTGVAFKISQAILGEAAIEFLPIASLATIADIVPLKDENRAIVKLGLDLMDKHLPVGIKSMLKQQKLNASTVSSTDIAFKIAPKLNASGRMGDAKDSLDLYLEKNPVKIKKLIEDIISHNTKRQALCNVVYDDCKKELATQNISELKSIILASDKWDQGILGIVCARLMDEYNRPVFLFSNVDGVLKGSARSLNELNVHALLTDMQDILETFGGHTVAAGLTLHASKFEEFKKRVNSYIHQNINDAVFTPISYYDDELEIGEISTDFAASLNALEPLGCENQPPRFLIKSQDISINPMKNFSNHANIIIGKKLNLVAFNYTDNYYKLKYANNKQFIFEFQDSKYKSQHVKGLLKEFNYDYNLNGKNIKNLEAFYLSQLSFLNNKNKAVFQEYSKPQLLDFINESALSVFGTCFVFSSAESLQNFDRNYTNESIYNFEVGENLSNHGFNAIVFAPSNIEFARSYKKIVFVDPVLDKGYLAAINQISTAKLFVPSQQQFDKNMLTKIYTHRDNFAKIYSIFKKIQEVRFVNLEALYQEFYRNKINFLDFYAAFLVFCELDLLNVFEDEGIYVKTIDSKKVPLNQSYIYNFINMLKATK